MPRISRKKSSTPNPAKSSVSLPTTRNVPSESLSDYSILLYGAKKIGKTSLASRFPDAYFLALEPGTRALEVYSTEVNDYKHFESLLDLLEEGDHDFRTIVVDTVDLLYDFAFTAVCKAKMINHPQDENDFGKTWGEISDKFKSAVMRLLKLPYGIIFISHDVEKEIQLRDGSKIDRVQPTMNRKAMAVVEAVVDIICNYHYEDKQRWLRIDGVENVVAGCRLEERFIREGGSPRVPGDRIVKIPMGLSSQEAYDNFIAAFNNEQKEIDPSDTSDTSNTRPKKTTRRRLKTRKDS